MRVVLDTNVLISAAINPHGAPAQVLDAWRERHYELVVSPPILKEVFAVIKRPTIRSRHGWTDDEIEFFIRSLQLYAVVTPGDMTVTEVEDDPDDDKFLACAVEGAADYIITGDPHLLDIASFQEIPILNPRQFLDIISP